MITKLLERAFSAMHWLVAYLADFVIGSSLEDSITHCQDDMEMHLKVMYGLGLSHYLAAKF